MQKDLIIELGTEELPPMSLCKMSMVFAEKIQAQLVNKKALFINIKSFATPRRLAVLIEGLQIEGNLIPDLLSKAAHDLPGKKMRWGNGDYVFARPIHWLVVLYGDQVINTVMFGVPASNITYGHRFLVPEAIRLNNATEYENVLQYSGKVIADFNKRKQLILQAIYQQEQLLTAKCVVDDLLLEEVTAITEYPVALVANFSQDFLILPKECLISAMGRHQKSFALIDQNNNLMPKFLLISNMPIDNVHNIIQGNQRVMHARLQDAAFLYKQDLKDNLNNNIDQLKIIILQEQLGSVYQQLIRIQKNAINIAKLLRLSLVQQEHINKAALLCKADLVTEMVLEFPELQGIMGYYYALHQEEPLGVALAIKEHYLPRFADDVLPSSMEGICLALAYRLDLLFGLFAIGKIPTGEKDPFSLRRHALAIIRIVIEKKLLLNVSELFNIVADNYKDILVIDNNIFDYLINFCIERLKNWYISKGITNKLFKAVTDQVRDNFYDIDLRIQAILDSNIMAADNLINANKRINNILAKNTINLPDIAHIALDKTLLMLPEEVKLYDKLITIKQEINPLLQQYEYNLLLQKLLTLTPYVDNFFDKVMVMADDEKIRTNRLVLLHKLANLFTTIADLSLLI